MVKKWAWIFSLFLLMVGNAFAQTSGGGPFTHSSGLNITDGTTSGFPYQLNVSPGSLSCSGGVCTITSGGSGSGNVGIGTATDPAYYATTGSTVSPFVNVHYVGSNVGIGTVTPGQLLDVFGTVRAANFTAKNTGQNNLLTLTNGSKTSNVYIDTGGYTHALGFGHVFEGTNNLVAAFVSSSASNVAWQVGNSFYNVYGYCGLDTSGNFFCGPFDDTKSYFASNGDGNLLNLQASSIYLAGGSTSDDGTASQLQINPTDGQHFMSGNGATTNWQTYDDNAGNLANVMNTGGAFQFISNNNVPLVGASNGDDAVMQIISNSMASWIEFGYRGTGDENVFISGAHSINNTVDIGDGLGTWSSLMAGSTHIYGGLSTDDGVIINQNNTAIIPLEVIDSTGDISLQVQADHSVFGFHNTLDSPSGNATFQSNVQVNGNVSIGTTFSGAKFIVNGGNVGIGTWLPASLLEVGTRAVNIQSGGNVGIGSVNPQAKLDLGTTGTIRVNNTSGIGWTVKTGANTACNTTCGTSSCVFGFDTGLAGSDVVGCTSTLSDTCLCAGP